MYRIAITNFTVKCYFNLNSSRPGRNLLCSCCDPPSFWILIQVQLDCNLMICAWGIFYKPCDGHRYEFTGISHLVTVLFVSLMWLYESHACISKRGQCLYIKERYILLLVWNWENWWSSEHCDYFGWHFLFSLANIHRANFNNGSFQWRLIELSCVLSSVS